ncbi:MAG: POTRA domain-containing protein [Myxococcota bacterium]
MTTIRIFVCAMLLCSSLCYAAQEKNYSTIQVEIKNPLDRDEQKELDESLRFFKQSPCQQETAQQAQQQILSLGRYRNAQCFVAQDNPTKLVCHIERFPAVRDVRFDGLPLAVSARQIKRHLIATAGQLWHNNPHVIKQLQQQVQQLLQRKGYESASVHTLIKPLANNSMVDVVMHIQAGHHTRVRHVIVDGESPIETKRIQHMFRNMCRSLSGVWDAFSGATFACYAKEKERYTLQKLRKKMDDLGYIQAVIHTEVITPSLQQQAQSIGCLIHNKKTQETVGRCVDLRISIHQGPRLVPRIVINRGQSLQLNTAGRFFRSLFAVEFFSRNFGKSPTGAQWPSDETILIHQLQQAMTFQRNRTVNEQQVQLSIAAMKQVLSKRGYLHAQIQALPIARTPEEIHVQFVINPGAPTPITQIRIVGSPYPISPKKLARKAKLKIRPRGTLYSGHLTAATLQQDTQSIQTYYRSRGYPQARVQNSVQLTNNQQAVLLYTVQPGQAHRVGSVRIVGTTNSLAIESLKQIANCKLLQHKQLKKKKTSLAAGQLCRGSFYLPQQLQEDSERIVQLHHDNGYDHIAVTTEVDDSRLDAIIVSFVVKTTNGKPIERTYFDNIFVEGNHKTNKSVLLRHIGLRKPHIAKPKDVDKGVGLLWQSALFSRVDTKEIPLESQPNRSTLMLQVVEKPSLTWDIALALSTDNFFMTEGILKETNLFGSMIQWEASLGWGLFWGRLSTLKNRFFWPRIWGSPLNLRLDVPNIYYEDYPYLKQRHLRIDFRSTLTWTLSATMNLGLSYTQRFDQWQKDNDYVPLPFASKPSKAIRELDGLLLVTKQSITTRGILEPSYSYIQIDDPINPHTGGRLRLALEYSGRIFASSPQYWIPKTEAAGYIPMGRSTLVLQTVVHRPFMTDPFVNWRILEEESGTGPLGGDRQVRGYAKGGINVNTLNQATNFSASPWQGAWRLQGNAEVRFLLAKQFLFGDLHAALFNDVGYITLCSGMWSCAPHQQPDAPEQSFHKFGWGVGAGLRHLLPIGPLTLDFAVAPLEKAAGLFNRQWRIHFSFGYPI